MATYKSDIQRLTSSREGDTYEALSAVLMSRTALLDATHEENQAREGMLGHVLSPGEFTRYRELLNVDETQRQLEVKSKEERLLLKAQAGHLTRLEELEAEAGDLKETIQRLEGQKSLQVSQEASK